jgi:DNA primase
VLVSAGDLCHVDTFEFYSARHRLQFTKQASLELGCEERIIKKDLGKLLLKLESLQEQQIQNALKPEKKPLN